MFDSADATAVWGDEVNKVFTFNLSTWQHKG